MHAVTRFGTRRVDLTTGVGPSPGLLVPIHRQRRDVGKVLNELKNKRVEKRARGGSAAVRWLARAEPLINRIKSWERSDPTALIPWVWFLCANGKPETSAVPLSRLCFRRADRRGRLFPVAAVLVLVVQATRFERSGW